MGDLTFEIASEWFGVGKDGSGRLISDGRSYDFSVPTQMGGQGAGTNPEELLTFAVCSCYTSTLFALLAKARLRADKLSVAARGKVADYPGEHARFAELHVSPTVHGGEIGRMEEYVRLACKARDRCFIGRTLRGNVSYEVDEVTVKGQQGSEQATAACSVLPVPAGAEGS